MSDHVDLSMDTLRWMYAQTITRALLATEPERVAALTAMAAELRAALGEVDLVAQVEAPVQGVSPWRSVATDPPPVGALVLLAYMAERCPSYRQVGCLTSDGFWTNDLKQSIGTPKLWFAIPELPEVAS